MKTRTIENIDQEQLNKEFAKEFERITKIGSVVHHATFFDRHDEKHKALICYYD
ncbi:hypothetical protein [Flavobacterium aestivum]|uniref:hypothetical protein n=1 Tax=Flavobacterium aestivum TaxID=3003257 RepID=UPI002482302F|nr:hypothetical protein [Flavobacterium aestivum]